MGNKQFTSQKLFKPFNERTNKDAFEKCLLSLLYEKALAGENNYTEQQIESIDNAINSIQIYEKALAKENNYTNKQQIELLNNAINAIQLYMSLTER